MATGRRRYSDHLLRAVAAESFSYAEVLRRLGLRQAGGTHAHVRRRIAAANIDTSHFLGRGVNRGPTKRGGPARLQPRDVLIQRPPLATRVKVHILRRAMIESGIEYECARCGCGPVWNGDSLVLHIDHVNGDHGDNRRENVRFLCPNCHSQTPTFGTRNISRQAEVVERQTREL